MPVKCRAYFKNTRARTKSYAATRIYFTNRQSFVRTIAHMKIPEPPLLSPSEIASMVYDSGHIRDRGTATRLEQRIAAYGTSKGIEGQTQGLVKAARAAYRALAGIKGANNRAAAARIVRAIESLLPTDEKFKQGYAEGWTDCAEDKPNKFKRDDGGPRSR
jgi:hypothetical protein